MNARPPLETTTTTINPTRTPCVCVCVCDNIIINKRLSSPLLFTCTVRSDYFSRLVPWSSRSRRRCEIERGTRCVDGTKIDIKYDNHDTRATRKRRTVILCRIRTACPAEHVRPCVMTGSRETTTRHTRTTHRKNVFASRSAATLAVCGYDDDDGGRRWTRIQRNLQTLREKNNLIFCVFVFFFWFFFRTRRCVLCGFACSV